MCSSPISRAQQSAGKRDACDPDVVRSVEGAVDLVEGDGQRPSFRLDEAGEFDHSAQRAASRYRLGPAAGKYGFVTMTGVVVGGDEIFEQGKIEGVGVAVVRSDVQADMARLVVDLRHGELEGAALLEPVPL